MGSLPVARAAGRMAWRVLSHRRFAVPLLGRDRFARFSHRTRNTKGNMPDLVICPCQHCSGKIEFDPANLSDENNKVTCPHCSLETILFVPPPIKAKMEAIISVAPPPFNRTPTSPKIHRIPSGSRILFLIVIILGPILALFAYNHWKSEQWSKNYDAELLRHDLALTNAVLTVATNEVPGITAIVGVLIGANEEHNFSNGWATVTVDYVPKDGGMARKTVPMKFYDFSTRDHPAAHLDYEEVERVRKEDEARQDAEHEAARKIKDAEDVANRHAEAMAIEVKAMAELVASEIKLKVTIGLFEPALGDAEIAKSSELAQALLSIDTKSSWEIQGDLLQEHLRNKWKELVRLPRYKQIREEVEKDNQVVKQTPGEIRDKVMERLAQESSIEEASVAELTEEFQKIISKPEYAAKLAKIANQGGEK